jgi:hypothetical protein
MSKNKVIKKSLLGIAIVFVLANNVYAANKTHITDVLGSGNSELDVSVALWNYSHPGNYYFTNGTVTPMDLKEQYRDVSAAYNFGFNDHLDVGLSIPLLMQDTIKRDYLNGSINTEDTTNYFGQGDISLHFKYLILDKQQDLLSWTISGAFSPSTAPSGPATTEVVQNGVVTTQGITGQYGKGYTSTHLATTVSIPSSVGDVYLQAVYTNNTEKSSAGIASKVGNISSFILGMESMLSDRTTLTPFINYSMYADGYNGATIVASYSNYEAGLLVTHDISKTFSVRFGLNYTILNPRTFNYPNGQSWTYSGNGNGMTLSTLIFF